MLIIELIRVDAASAFEKVVAAPNLSDLESHLLDLRHEAQNLANGTVGQGFSMSGSTTLARFHKYYGPLATAAVQAATQSKPVPASVGAFVADPRPPIPSIWDEQSNNWDMIDGASVELAFPDEQGASEGEVAAPAAAKGNTYFLSLRPADRPNPPVRTCEYCFPASSAGKIEGIVLFFTHTRTRVVAAKSAGALPSVHAAGQTLGGNPSAWTVRWRPDPDQTSPICLSLSYIGDPPHVRDWTWLVSWGADDEIPPPVVRPGSPLPRTPSHVHGTRDEELATSYVLTYSEEFKVREDLVHAATKHKTDKEFFLEMDRQSNPQSGAKSAQEHVSLGTYLANRYVRRAEAGAFGQTLVTPAHDLVSWRGKATSAGDLLTDLMKVHYPSKGPLGFDRDEVRDAFLRFAGGELTIFATHGAPNGLNLLCFAELADLLVRMQYKLKVWKPLFAIFVNTARIYVSSYHLCGVDARTFCSYRVDHNPTGARAWTDEWKDALEQQGLPPLQAYDAVVQAALYDDIEDPNKVRRAMNLRDVGCAGRVGELLGERR